MMIGVLIFLIGIVGMSCLMKENVIVMSGCVIEVVGDVDVFLFDKIGIIILGNWWVSDFLLVYGVSEE